LPLEDVPDAHDGRLLCTALEPPSCIHHEICITKLHRESDIARVNKEMYFISAFALVQQWAVSSPWTIRKSTLKREQEFENKYIQELGREDALQIGCPRFWICL
jgi:hypothetical protein